MASMTPEEVQAMLEDASKPGKGNDLPLGQNDVIVERVQPEDKLTNGTNNLKLTLRVVDAEKRSGFLHLYNSSGAIPKFLLGLKALGLDNDTIVELIDIDDQKAFQAALEEAGPVLGARLSVNVAEEEWDGSMRPKLWLNDILPDAEEEDFASEEAPAAPSAAPEAPF